MPRPFAIPAVLALALLLSAGLSRAETPVGSNVESRITLAFQVDPDAIEPWLPEGWSPVPLPRGPMAGANLLLVLADRLIDLDAEGTPASPPTNRYAVLAGVARADDGSGVRSYVYRVFATNAGPNPYGNAVSADVRRSTSTEGPANAGRARSEAWVVAPEAGGEMTLSLGFTSGTPSWGAGESNIHSNVIAGFNRIYRYDQLVDLAMSAPLGKPLAGELSYATSIPELAAVLDGSETLIAILDIPVYVREMFLP